MTTYTAADVHAEYEKHPNTFSADLTDEQATTIASLWNTIKASVLKRYDEDSVGALFQYTAGASFQFTNLAITAAHIVDGTLTVEELIEDERNFIDALNFACGMTDVAIFASQEMGVDIKPMRQQVELNREIAIGLIKHYLPN